MKVRVSVDFYKVPAHAGIPGNERADRLASEAASNRATIEKKLGTCTLREALFTSEPLARLKKNRKNQNVEIKTKNGGNSRNGPKNSDQLGLHIKEINSGSLKENEETL